jgi:hypothetical protein
VLNGERENSPQNKASQLTVSAFESAHTGMIINKYKTMLRVIYKKFKNTKRVDFNKKK